MFSNFKHCCLCMLRGGALKQTTNGISWVHIICALLHENAKFATDLFRGPIAIDQPADVDTSENDSKRHFHP